MIKSLLDRHDLWVASAAIIGIAAYAGLWWAGSPHANWPLWTVLAIGGSAVVIELGVKLSQGEYGADLLAGVSIVTAILLGEWLAGALVVLMLSGGEAIESFAMERAKSVLSALAKRAPTIAHRRCPGSQERDDVPVESLAPGDEVVVFPHEICPVDGEVIDGHGGMDESFLTGEPYLVSKAPGTTVISGALNGRAALTIRASRRAADSRYAQIMKVMHESEQRRPAMRRLGDMLGAWYAPLALAIAGVAWALSGDATRFLSVLVIATPCPLLIGIPVAIIGAVSLAARCGVIVKNPAALEQIVGCRTMLFDKTGTLTYGRPALVHETTAPGFDADDVLAWATAAERYSKHPLAQAVVDRAVERKVPALEAAEVHEAPGMGLQAIVAGRRVLVTHRKGVAAIDPAGAAQIPPAEIGLECAIVVDDRWAGMFRFQDTPRSDGRPFIGHLGKHAIDRVMIVSGDRRVEVEDLAARLGIERFHAEQTPEQKLALVEAETRRAKTIYVGDGINDAPALHAATVGIAFGQAGDVTAQAADAVILDSSLRRVDQLLHIGQRMRTIALQSALGGIALSVVGMALAAAGYLPPVYGALGQELIDVLAVLNAARVAWPPKDLSDF